MHSRRILGACTSNSFARSIQLSRCRWGTWRVLLMRGMKAAESSFRGRRSTGSAADCLNVDSSCRCLILPSIDSVQLSSSSTLPNFPPRPVPGRSAQCWTRCVTPTSSSPTFFIFFFFSSARPPSPSSSLPLFFLFSPTDVELRPYPGVSINDVIISTEGMVVVVAMGRRRRVTTKNGTGSPLAKASLASIQ